MQQPEDMFQFRGGLTPFSYWEFAVPAPSQMQAGTL
jgi:hypothetical protein